MLISKCQQYLYDMKYSNQCNYHLPKYFFLQLAGLYAAADVKYVKNLKSDLSSYYFRDIDGFYQCRVCPDYKQKSSGNMRAHVESKHYTPGYNCKVCGKYFRIQISLHNHNRTCKAALYWNKLSSLPSSLWSLTLFSFSVVSSGPLAQVESMVIKAQTSMGLSGFSCSACGVNSSNRMDIVRHVEAKHFYLQIPCKFCGKILKTRLNLQRHLRSHHPESKANIKAVVDWHIDQI